MSASLEKLLQHPALWRASGQMGRALECLPTGSSELDALLPGGGWPFPALIELLTPRCGLGEINVLLPALRQLQVPSPGTSRVIAWFNPPFIPYAPALAERGLELSQQLLSGPLTATQTLWAMEQALRSGACGAVLAWAEQARTQDLRRLKLASMAGNCLGVLFRSPRHRAQSSIASVRLMLSGEAQELNIEILKVQRGRPGRLALRQ